MQIVGGERKLLDELDFDRTRFLRIEMANFSCYFSSLLTPTAATHSHHYDTETNAHYLVLGRLFENGIASSPGFATHLMQVFNRDGTEGIERVDGDFVFIVHRPDGPSTEIFADKYGMIQLFFCHARGLVFTTNIEILLQNFTENQIDFAAVYDFLNYSTLLGNRTLKVGVSVLAGGSVLRSTPDGVRVARFHDFLHCEKNISRKKLKREIVDRYRAAVKKRLDREIEATCLFLTGGMDSRFLLATMNRFTDSRIDCYHFSQPVSSEMNVAEQAAAIGGNRFLPISLDPRDFVENAYTYVRLTGGMDMFPQSYLLKIASDLRKAGKSLFLTGFALDVLLGGTFLNEEALAWRGKFSEFVGKNRPLLKMHAFGREEFRTLCKPGVYETLFAKSRDNLRSEAEKYDLHSTRDVIQPFAIRNRLTRTVLLREIAPGRSLDAYYPSMDSDFLDIVSSTSAADRCNHRIYREIFMEHYPEYSSIPYNNTTLPINAPLDSWRSGTRRQHEKELVHVRNNREDGFSGYWKHYYSDFNGYSRYDVDWKRCIEHTLLTEDAYIVRKLFSLDRIMEYYRDHISAKQNNRVKLVYLLSLEMFFREFLNLDTA